jgi:hypothetical protein
VAVADQFDAAATLAAVGRAYGSGRNPILSEFKYRAAEGAKSLVLTLHGALWRNARGNSRGAWAVTMSDLLARKLGLRPRDPNQLPIVGAAPEPPLPVSPEVLAMYTVDYLKFRGTYIDLDSCGTGYYSSFLDQSFIGAYAQILAQLLRHPVTVKGPRGLLYAEPGTGVSYVKPNSQAPALPDDQAFSTAAGGQ